jgi:hypothetical protein
VRSRLQSATATKRISRGISKTVPLRVRIDIALIERVQSFLRNVKKNLVTLSGIN